MTNETAQYLILDQVYGWKEDSRPRAGYGLATTAEGHRQLFPLPGRSSLLIDSQRQENTFVTPSALAVDSKGRIAVVDSETNQLILIDPKRKELNVITGIGGAGTSARNFSAPQGVALSNSGAIVIADTGNHRVQIFSAGYNLLQTWGRVDAEGNPLPGSEDKEFDRPWSVRVDDCGNVFVVDRGNARVQKISSRGKWLSDIGRPCLTDPTRVALGPDGLIAIVDPGQQAVVVVSPRRISPRTISVKDPRSATFDKDGTLYVGDATGLIGVYTRLADTDTYKLIGQGSANVDGEIVDLACVSEPAPYLVAIIKESFNGLRQRLWRIEPIGTFQHEGRLVTTVIDSGLEKCQWHRLLLDAVLPAKESANTTNLGAGSVEIESYTSEHGDIDIDQPEISWQRCVLTGDDNPDCLVQSGPGRYLWLRVTLRSNGIASPLIKSIKVFYPRVSYLQYLPAVYQEDTDSRIFLDRFLSIFQTEFDNFDRQIDNVWQLFDPASVSEKHFDWLASWLGLFIQPDSLIDLRCRFECVTEQPCQPPPECPSDTEDSSNDTSSPLMEWTIERKRELLKKAFESYRLRGTVKGLQTAIRDHTGAHFATILEHFRLRRWPVLSVIAGKDADDDPCVPPQPPQKGLCGEISKDYKVSLPLDGTVRLWSRAFYKRLQLNSFSQIGHFRLLGTPEPALEPLDWGAHRFTVFFPASPYSVKTTMEKVQQVVEREKPAHTQAELCPVLPRLRVGVQATVGADAVVGGISHLVLNSLSTLNYDAILSCSREESRLRASGTSLRPRTGISTVLS